MLTGKGPEAEKKSTDTCHTRMACPTMGPYLGLSQPGRVLSKDRVRAIVLPG